MKHLEDILKESLLDVDATSEKLDKHMQLIEFLKKYETNSDPKAYARDIKKIIKDLNLNKYKSVGWKPGRKLIGIINNDQGFYIGNKDKERDTYQYEYGFCDKWNSNITDLVGTEARQCKLYELKNENEFVYDVFIEYFQNQIFIN